MVSPGKRIPMREKRTGSVRIVTPKELMSTVECPSHASVTCELLHLDGSGLAKAGAIGRQLLIVHSRKRCPSQRRTREAREVGGSRGSVLPSAILFESDAETSSTPKSTSCEICAKRLPCFAKALGLRTRSRGAFRLLSAKQSFDSFPERSSGLWRASASDEHGDAGAVQNASGQIAHDVVPKQTTRLRCAG